MGRDITAKENVRSRGNREGKCQVTGAEENVRLLVRRKMSGRSLLDLGSGKFNVVDRNGRLW